MDDQAKYEALKSEHETLPAWLVRPEGEAAIVYIRVLRDKGGLARVDVATEDPADGFQLVFGAAEFGQRFADPQ